MSAESLENSTRRFSDGEKLQIVKQASNFCPKKVINVLPKGLDLTPLQLGQLMVKY